ncbi:MAG: signal transduction histidine kinase [Mycobacterium sp.]|nr:signal transduction histidine kinase [Mycobacterium sp.]
MKTTVRAVASPSQWTVRTRTAVAATAVVTVCLMLAGTALLVLLFRSLESSARSAAEARAGQVSEQLATEAPAELDRSLLATDSQVGVVQVVDQNGKVVAQSLGSPGAPLSSRSIAPGTTAFLGRMQPDPDNDFWVTGQGVTSPVGPVTVLVGADRDPVENVVMTVAGLLAIGGPIVVAVVAFGTYRLVGSALRPVERIRARVASTTSGNLAERIPVPAADDEIARLAVTMNNMLDRLEAGQTAQRRFVSDASHELRSPLSTIIAALELADTRPELLDRPMIEDSLLPEAHRMRRLVEDLLLLARADEHSGKHPETDVDLDDLIYAEASRVRTITDLKVRSSVTPIRVSGDPRALSRLLRNLVDNAIRHAHNEVRLECDEIDGAARMVVEDDGPGIPLSERSRVFDRFVRLDTPRARESGGAGLGLAIVTEIVAAHHGTVTVCEPPSGGTRFEVRLPLLVAEAVADATHRLDAVSGEG